MANESLTNDEIQLIRDTWKPVRENMDPVGKLLFTTMFDMFPEYRSLFTKLKEEDKDLLESSKFLKHATANVMITFTKLVDSLDQPRELSELLSAIGGRHFRRNVNSNHFKAIISIVHETLKKGLGELLTPEAEQAWLKMLSANMALMGESCDAAGKQTKD